ncbi:MAG: hypothetical protein AAGD09_03450 [Cyanobacteria bacterium P01_F01_bin.56]
MDAIARIDQLEQEVSALKVLLGVKIEDWVSPEKAARLTGLPSKSYVMTLINKAELARATNQKYQVVWGVHYRRPAETSYWQVNWSALNELINTIPPEQWNEVKDFSQA